MWWMFLAGMALAKPVDLSIQIKDNAEFDSDVTVNVNNGTANMAVQIGTHEVIEHGGLVGKDTIIFHSTVRYVAIDATPQGADGPVQWDSRSDTPPPAILGDAVKVLGQQFRVTLDPKLATSIGAIDGGETPGEPLGLAQALQLLPTGEHEIGETFTSSPMLGDKPVPVDWSIESHKKKVALTTCKATAGPVGGSVACTAQIDTKRHLPKQVGLQASMGPQDMRLDITVNRAK